MIEFSKDYRGPDITNKDHDYLEDFNPRIQYKFREAELINELQLYIDKTYEQHYAGGKIQATEDIIDDGVSFLDRTIGKKR